MESLKIDPKKYGLSSRTELRQKGEAGIIILINRKSRIIMKDGKSILEKAGKIKEAAPEMTVAVETTAPVCSKTEIFLQENGIGLIQKTSV